MDRRTYLAALGTAAVGGLAGCTGQQIMTVTPGRPIRVPVGRGEVITIPASGEQLRYVARDDQRFDVYYFTSGEDLAAYRAYTQGDDPERTPAGDPEIGDHATPDPDKAGVYTAATPDQGRVTIDADGESYLVIDHSNYRRETPPGENAGPLSVALELSVTESAMPF